VFAAGAIITFITLWGVVMAGGLYATRHQPPDDAISDLPRDDGRPVGAVINAHTASVNLPIDAPAPAG
jgi:hypothetical protein